MSTSAVTVDVYCINKSESMCMLFDVSLCSTLKELRLRAEQEVGQLLPKSGYRFMMEREVAEWDAELLLTVEKIGIGDAEEDEYRINIMEESQLEEEQMEKAREKMKAFVATVGESDSSGAEEEESKNQEKEDDFGRSWKEREKAAIEIDGESESLGAAGNMGSDGKDKEGKAEAQKGPAESVWEKLQSPDSCQIKGIKIFKVAEIEESVGKEKECRIFWNKKAKEMHKTITDKQKLYNHIHQAWRMHKEERTGEGSGKLKKSTLEKNIERVQQAKQRCATLQNEFCD